MDYSKVVSAGQADFKQCQDEWEKIVARNYEENGGFDYLNYIDLTKGLASLMAEYNLTKAQLLKLCFAVDDELIEDLKNRGYKIDTSGNRAFAESLANALNRCENLVSRMKMKYSELNMMIDENGGSKPISFDETIAMMSFQIGFEIKDDITLSRFNGYRKILKERAERAKEKTIEI